MSYDESEIFICDCSDVSHNIIFQFWDFGKDEKLWRPANANCELMVAVFLNDYPSFWKRIWLGIKYILGYKSKYGHYDVMTIRYEDVPRMKKILDKFTRRVDVYTEKLKKEDEKRLQENPEDVPSLKAEIKRLNEVIHDIYFD